MDQTLKLKLHDYSKSLLTLEESLQNPPSDLIRDAVIKRFEFTFELAWKTGKILLSEIYGIEAASPKSTFRELRRVNLLSDAETETCLRMTDDRNEIVHRYDLAFLKKVFARIGKKYSRLLQKLEKNYHSSIESTPLH